MHNYDAVRKTFFTSAGSKLSSMLENRVFDEKTQEDFILWCEKVYSGKDPLEIAAEVLAEFQRNAFEEDYILKPLFKVHKDLVCSDFAESLYKHIFS